MNDGMDEATDITVTREELDALGTIHPAVPRPLNFTGICPTEYKVLIDPTPIADKIGSIIIPDQAKETEKYAQIKGRIVARSPLAFSYATPEEWEANKARKPEAGDLVLYAKYAGVRVKGKDGQEYLLVNDKDITATIEE
jgi:co-chaperonin GroES (HSP10)